MERNKADMDQLMRAIETRLGQRTPWQEWPGGWRDDIESALIDAVFSARAVYRSAGGKGVYDQVLRWQGRRSRATFTLVALREEIDEVRPQQWATEFGNRQLSPSRPSAAPGGATKAAAVRQAADVLSEQVEISSASSVTEANVAEVRRSMRTVQGVGFATAEYFLMLLGWPGVKPDRMIHRFLRDALGQPLSDAEAKEAISRAAASLGVPERDLDHAIWHYESLRASTR